MERRQFPKPVHVSIGSTVAHCERCGGEEFVRALVSRRGEKTDTMLCFACGAEHLYTALLSQISVAVMRRADKALRDSEELRKRLEELEKKDAAPRDY